MRDILSGKDPQVSAFQEVIARSAADILVLADVDYDLGGITATELARLTNFPHSLALMPNRGMATGEDLNADGRFGTPSDAQGYGSFSGEGGMVVLSRYPFDLEGIQDFSDFLWLDLPGDIAPEGTNPIQRLSTTTHAVVPVQIPNAPELHLMTWHATPPVFDGPEDRNGRRNHDEAAFWLRFLDGEFSAEAPKHFVLAGAANLDPLDGEGRPSALLKLLQHRLISNVTPKSAGGVIAAETEKGANLRHDGDPASDTANWRDDPGPGNLRVDYLLPSRTLSIEQSGVLWPTPDDPLSKAVQAASRHRLIWVDLRF